MAVRKEHRLSRFEPSHERVRPWVKQERAKRRIESGQRSEDTETDGSATVEPVAAPVPAPKGNMLFASLFVFSLLIPINMSLGSILLQPYRILLVVLFFPLAAAFFKGPLHRFDYLMIFSTVWAGLALAVNHPLSDSIETIGLQFVEFLVAYMLGRVAIRSGDDFRRLSTIVFWCVLILLPFGVMESVLKKPIALDLIPGSIPSITIGERFNLRRAQTIFAHPIHHGAFASTALGLAWFAMSYRSSGFSRLFRAFIVIICTVTSLSSGALFSLVFQIGLIAWELILNRVTRRWTIFAILCAIGYVAVDLVSVRSPFHVVVNYATFSSGSAYNRILIWDFGTQNVADNPIFGLGLNDWERPRWMGASVDNYWLLHFMRFGIPSGAAFMWALYLILRQVSLARLLDPTDLASRAGFLVSFGGIVMAGSTVHYWHGLGSFVVFIFASGVWAIDTSNRLAANEAAQAAPEPPTDIRAEPRKRS